MLRLVSFNIKLLPQIAYLEIVSHLGKELIENIGKKPIINKKNVEAVILPNSFGL